MTRKLWISGGLAAAALVGMFVWAFRPQPIPVETAEVRKGLFEQTIDEDGKTRVRERYVVSAPVAGRLSRVRVKAGDVVRAGAAVAELSPAVPAMIDARTARELSERVGAALIAAIASQPELLATLRSAFAGWQGEIERDSADAVTATVARFAADGLWLCELFGIDGLSPAMRDEVRLRLLGMVS